MSDFRNGGIPTRSARLARRTFAAAVGGALKKRGWYRSALAVVLGGAFAVVGLMAATSFASVAWVPPDFVGEQQDRVAGTVSVQEDVGPSVSLTPRQAVERAWKLAKASGSYSFRSEIVQTTLPAPKLSSAGRRAREEHLTVDGSIDQPAKSMEMILWTGANLEPENGVQVRVEGDRAYGRVGDQGQWEEVDNMAGAFAPGGDPLGFLSGVANVQLGATETRSFPGTNLPVTHTRYTFDLDGRAFAEYVAEQIEAHLIRSGELPPGGKMPLPDAYRNMTGEGTIWLSEDGLPARLAMDLDLGRQDNGERVYGEFETDYFEFDKTRLVRAEAGVLEDPQTWLAARLPETAEDTYKLAATSGFWLVLALAVLVSLRFYRTREFHVTVVALVLASMVGVPLLRTHGVSASVDEREVRVAEHEMIQKRAEAVDEAQGLLKSSF